MPDMMIRDLPGAIPPSEQLQRIEAGDLAWPQQSHDDATAMQIVVTDVERTESFLVSRQYIRAWDLGDRLFYAFVSPINWPGTETPRATLGMPLVATHLFSLLSAVVQAIFSGSKPLQIDPRPGTSTATAQANQALIMWELEECGFKEELVYFLFDLFLYGTGNLWWGFRPVTKNKRRKVRREVKATLGETRSTESPELPKSPKSGLGSLAGLAGSSSGDGLSGLAEPTAPTSEAENSQDGENSQNVENSQPAEKVTSSQPVRMETVTVSDDITWVLPWVEYAHIRHYGVSPGCRRRDVRTSPYAYRRMYLSADDLDQLRDQDGYQNIPSREMLEKLVTPDKEAPTTSPTEVGTFNNTINIGKKSNPRWMDATADPLKQGFEVIEYWTADRTIAVFERQLCIRNTTHELGEIPSLSSAFQISPDSYYGIGLTHLIGNFQSVMQGTVNLFLDNMSLDLNGMFVTGKGYNSPGQAIWSSPGKVIKVDDAQQFRPLERQSTGAADTMGVIEACQGWAEQADGASAISMQGALPAGKSSITRTAGGANELGGGSRTRSEFVIDSIADLVIIPLVMKFMDMNFDNLAPEQIKQILGEQLGHIYEEDPLNILNGSYKVTIAAGARLAARNAIAQQWPLIVNMITSPSVIQSLQTEGKKINFSWIVDQTFEAANYPGKNEMVVDMSKDDLDRMKAMNPAMASIARDQAKVEAETEGQLQVEEAKAGGRALIQTLKHSYEVDAASAPAFGEQ